VARLVIEGVVVVELVRQRAQKVHVERQRLMTREDRDGGRPAALLPIQARRSWRSRSAPPSHLRASSAAAVRREPSRSLPYQLDDDNSFDDKRATEIAVALEQRLLDEERLADQRHR